MSIIFFFCFSQGIHKFAKHSFPKKIMFKFNLFFSFNWLKCYFYQMVHSLIHFRRRRRLKLKTKCYLAPFPIYNRFVFVKCQKIALAFVWLFRRLLRMWMRECVCVCVRIFQNSLWFIVNDIRRPCSICFTCCYRFFLDSWLANWYVFAFNSLNYNKCHVNASQTKMLNKHSSQFPCDDAIRSNYFENEKIQQPKKKWTNEKKEKKKKYDKIEKNWSPKETNKTREKKISFKAYIIGNATCVGNFRQTCDS